MHVRKTLAVVSWSIGGLILLVAVPFCWLLKDGLGPSAVDSHGLEAVRRFAVTVAECAVWYLPPLLLGCAVFPWASRRPDSRP